MNIKQLRNFLLLWSVSVLALASATDYPTAESRTELPYISIPNHPGLPKNFRTFCIGRIQVLVSGQFSEGNLATLVKQFPGKRITIIDLRQESHFFVNGDAVSVSNGPENSDNLGLSLEEINIKNSQFVTRALEDGYIGLYTGKEKIQVPVDGKQEQREVFQQYEKIKVTSAYTEQQLTDQYGLNYQLVPITDHVYGSIVANTDLLIKTILAASANSDTIYFHCHAGKGRAPTAAIMAKILLEAKQRSFNDIAASFDDSSIDKVKFQQRRGLFQLFYHYSREVDPRCESFSEWLMRHDLQVPPEGKKK